LECVCSGNRFTTQCIGSNKAATIRKLGTRLFTRIKEANDRKLIEDFLAQP